jgi:hypothetical protein
MWKGPKPRDRRVGGRNKDQVTIPQTKSSWFVFRIWIIDRKCCCSQVWSGEFFISLLSIERITEIQYRLTPYTNDTFTCVSNGRSY